jgi:hypothetical protein
MDAVYESRRSDSPYVHTIWRVGVEHDNSPVCPADSRWNLLFARRGSQARVTVEGPTTQHVPKNQFEGSEFLVIKFHLGIYMPRLPVSDVVNTDALLPEAAGKTFWLNGSAWEYPSFENVETFVARLAREGLLVREPVVAAVLQDQQPQPVSFRTVRRRFLTSTGLTPKAIQQIERANQAMELLERGVSILDTVYEAGYADQPHLTRALRRYIGTTPAQIARLSQPA